MLPRCGGSARRIPEHVQRVPVSWRHTGRLQEIVDPVSRGHGSSSSHSPAGDEERADEPGKGVFRTFPQIKKSAKVAPHSGSELPPHSSSWTAAAQLRLRRVDAAQGETRWQDVLLEQTC